MKPKNSSTEADSVFKQFTDEVRERAQEVNQARRNLERSFRSARSGQERETSRQDLLLAYEKAEEGLKRLIENRSADGQLNVYFTRSSRGRTFHVRGVEVELVHAKGFGRDQSIKAVIVRGLISRDGGNQPGNYSSRSSSSSVPKP